MSSSRKILIIYSPGKGIHSLLKTLERFRTEKVYVLIHEDDSKVVYRELRRISRNNLKILVLSGRDAEVKALKILVDSEPDIVIDCDQYNKLVVFKNLLKHSRLRLEQCIA
ncbi:MAG: hypothetical protein QXT88_02770 [Desulfurococcaceae archaeon]|uniref:Uncharacterized protein n=1 Tax=Staphylothermus marinus TaxID=2280 RepID=A0A7C4NPP5_STAMA